jgi:transposase
MSESKKRAKRSFTPEFKEQAIRLSRELGTVAAACRQLDLSDSLLRTWIREQKAAQGQGQSLGEAMATKEHLAKLERENARLREEVAILKKATAYFAADHLPRSTPGSRPTPGSSR